MSVPAAYVSVILIWTTTPLAIKWSGEGSHVLFAVTARMFIAAIGSLALLWLSRHPIPWHRKARKVYLVNGLTIFGAMGFSYWGAQHIPSGWLSVIFGLSPITTGVLATIVLGERNLTPIKIVGMFMGIGGLAIIFGEGASMNSNQVAGVLAILAAMVIHSTGAVTLKKLNAGIPALASTAGGVTVATIMFQTTWIALDTNLPPIITGQAAWSILYLGVAGSILGFSLYYYLLKNAEATRVALITLITPVSALFLGTWLNDEPLGFAILAGTAVIILGLVVFQFGEGWLKRVSRIQVKA